MGLERYRPARPTPARNRRADTLALVRAGYDTTAAVAEKLRMNEAGAAKRLRELMAAGLVTRSWVQDDRPGYAHFVYRVKEDT